MSFIKSLLNKILGADGGESATAPLPSPQKEPSDDSFERERNSLAELCKMGDSAAMYDMALLWLGKFTDEERVLIENYEADNSKENLTALWEYLKHNRNLIKFEYYMMWITRAAVYGAPKAKAIAERCSYYKEKAYVPYRYYVGSRTSEPYWSSNLFYEAGFIDMIRNKEDCGLIFHKDLGYFEFYYVSYYEPPDEDGFGSETEYESVFYDEFFRRIPVRIDAKPEEVIFKLKKLEAERDSYWQKRGENTAGKYSSLLKDNKKQ